MSEMTDKELIELAAKAIGAKYYADRDWPGICLSCEPDILPFYVNSRGSGAVEWNPLTDDGDALRLAVKLGIRFHRIGHKVHAIGLEQIEEYCDEGKDKAARRAITRAAAEIGKRMP